VEEKAKEDEDWSDDDGNVDKDDMFKAID